VIAVAAFVFSALLVSGVALWVWATGRAATQHTQRPLWDIAWRRFAVRVARRQAVAEQRRVARRAFERLADAARDRRTPLSGRNEYPDDDGPVR
jgi:hypothetical protein